jgi:hypothetical protein
MYLAAYVFRVALSNRRLVACSQSEVTFRYRPSGTQRWQLCTLHPLEFMRRFLQHVLPKGFVKVRYYGFFSPGQRQVLAQICNYLTPYHLSEVTMREKEQGQSTSVPAWQCCPHCGQPLHLTRTVATLKQQWQPP